MLEINTSYQQTQTTFSLNLILSKAVKEKFSTLFYSGKPLDNETISHLYGYNPLAFITDSRLFDYRNDHWYQIENINVFYGTFLAQHQNKISKELENIVFTGGLMSFFTFEYKNTLEEKKLYKKKKTLLPTYMLVLYENIEVYNPKHHLKTIIRQKITANTLPPITPQKEKILHKKYKTIFTETEIFPKNIQNFFRKNKDKEKQNFQKNVFKIKKIHSPRRRLPSQS